MKEFAPNRDFRTPEKEEGGDEEDYSTVIIMRRENSWSKFTQHPKCKWFYVYLLVNQTAHKNNKILKSF